MPATPSHAPVRFVSRPVQESLKTRFSKHLCSFVLSVLFFSAFILFLLWLALRPHRPRFHVSSFSTTPFPPPSPSASSLSVQLSIRNPNRKIGFYFGPISASVYYRGNPVWSNPDLGGPFYQPPKNTTDLGGRLGAGSIGPGDSAGMQNDLSESGSVGFRLVLKSTVRFSYSTLGTRKQTMHVSCDVHVGPDGQIMPDSKNRRCSIYFF